MIAVLTMADVNVASVVDLLERFGLTLRQLAPGDAVEGSFWGDSEAGVVGNSIVVRSDTPVHSLLHETCHVICMDDERRANLHTDAGGDDLEEAAVCYLQILLADAIDGVGRDRLMQDMDTWGYSFRLGSTRRWFEDDAEDALAWLLEHELVDAAGEVRFRLRA